MSSKRKFKNLIDSDSNKEESEGDTSDSGSDWENNKKKKRKLNGTKSSKKIKQKSSKHSSDESMSEPEEGEVSADSDSSNDELSELEFDDGLDENLIGDEEDRARLDQMTEKEREQEIYNRVEKREMMKARFEIEKKLRLAKRKEQQKKKKKDVSERQTKTNSSGLTDRKKAMEESKGKRDKFAELKAKREDKLQKAEEREKKEKEAEEKRKMKEVSQESESDSEKTDDKETKTKQKLKASDVFSSDSEESDEEVPAKPTRKISSSSSSSSSSSDSDSERSDADDKKEEEKKFLTCKDDLEKIRLSRHKMGIYVHLRLFSDAVVGCFVRIGIGNNATSKEPVYRVAEILKVVETSKIYKLENTRTNKGLLLRHGKQERVFRLEFVSNSKIQQHEYERWITSCAANDVSLPTLEHIRKKQKDIHDLLTYQFSNDDINHMVEQKQKFSENPTNYAVAKTVLLKERELAQQRGEEEEIEKINGQIFELDEKASVLHKKRTQTIASISYINERNRKNNVEKAERAIMIESEERKQAVADPFTRRSTRPKIMSIGDKKEQVMTSELLKKLEEEQAEKEQQEKRRKEEEAAANKKRAEEERKREEEKKKTTTHDPFVAHNFNIEIDLDVTDPAASMVPISRPSTSTLPSTNGTVSSSSAPKRSLKFEEYKKLKGLI